MLACGEKVKVGCCQEGGGHVSLSVRQAPLCRSWSVEDTRLINILGTEKSEHRSDVVKHNSNERGNK